MWADRLAYLILAGLAVDIFALFLPQRNSHIVASIGANLLIFGGVWGELWFAKRARDADDSRVAEANASAARAHERAAALETEAAEARERTAEIERLAAWRHILPDQQTKIVQAIRGKIPMIAFINFEDQSPESVMYGKEFEKLLIFAGVKNIQMRPNHILVGGEPLFGVNCCSTPDPIYGQLFCEAFTAAGVPISLGGVTPTIPPPQNPSVWIYVGFKPP